MNDILKNNTLIEETEFISETLMQIAPRSLNIGLLNGKFGVAIYFFRLAEVTGNQQHQEFAENLLDEIFEKVASSVNPLNFESGLAGVAWGIEYLVVNDFIEADTDDVLADADDIIYQYIVNEHSIPIGLLKGLMGFGFYILSRLERKDLNANTMQVKIFKNLLIEIINKVSTYIEEDKNIFREPGIFDITWDLPHCLIFFSNAYKLNIYNVKIIKILENLSPVVLSILPVSQCNRLHLLLGMQHVLHLVDLQGWRTHAMLLKQTIIPTTIIDKELKDKLISIANGVAGYSFIVNQLNQFGVNIIFNPQEIAKRITESEYWAEMKNNKYIEHENMGLLHGFSGIGMELLRYN